MQINDFAFSEMHNKEGAHANPRAYLLYVTVRNEQLACKGCASRNGRCVEHKMVSARKPDTVRRSLKAKIKSKRGYELLRSPARYDKGENYEHVICNQVSLTTQT